MTEVIIGSRESKLAVLQSEMVKSYIEQKSRCGRLFCSMPGTEKAKWHGSCYIKIIDTAPF